MIFGLFVCRVVEYLVVARFGGLLGFFGFVVLLFFG